MRDEMHERPVMVKRWRFHLKCDSLIIPQKVVSLRRAGLRNRWGDFGRHHTGSDV